MRLNVADAFIGNINFTITFDFLGMKSFCKLKSDINFRGKDALLKIEQLPMKRRLLGFTIDDQTVDLNGGEIIYKDGLKIVGYIKRSGFGYTVNKHIGYGYVEIEESERICSTKNTVEKLMKSNYEIEIMGKRVVAEPFIKALYDSKRQKIFV